jgi:hypothetical protein
MKWGVRKDGPGASEKPTKADKKEAKANFRAESAKVMEKRLANGLDRKVLTQDQYAKLATKDVLIKKGANLSRITVRTDESSAPMVYVSTNAKDATVYRGVLPGINRLQSLRAKTNYEVTLQAVNTLKSPSEKARVDAFVELMDMPAIKTKDDKLITGREFLEKSGYKDEVKKMDSFKLGLEFYDEFVQSQGMAKAPLNSAYFDSLRKKGYNALQDDNDRNILSKDPWIVLDPGGNLKNTGIKALTPKDINEAKKVLKVPD